MDTDIEGIIKKLLPLVNKNEKRLCHKVRTARYYGGIATVDVVGCYLDCAFCWVPEFKRFPEMIKMRMNDFRYLSPEETSEILINLAKSNNLKSVRLSGGEPLLNKDHLLKTVGLTTNAGYNYILETNGLLLDSNFIKKLDEFADDIYIYFSLKGTSPTKFSELTGRNQQYWQKQLDSLHLLTSYEFKIGINIMSDFLNGGNLLFLLERLSEINEQLPLAIDIKRTSMFPHVEKRLQERGISVCENVIDKEKYRTLLLAHYRDIYEQNKNNIIDLGIMNFFDFGKLR